MAKKPETLFKEKVLRDLKSLPGIWFYKTNDVSQRGIPDLIICASGAFIAVELKAEGEQIDPNGLQYWTLQQIAEAGGHSISCCPQTWGEAFKLIKKLHASAVKKASAQIDKTGLN